MFARCYGFNTIGLRYFNVFGPRQDPNGAYAAVIPKWISAICATSRCTSTATAKPAATSTYVDNAVQANLLAATTEGRGALNQVYNVAAGEQTSLNRLYEMMREHLPRNSPHLAEAEANYREFRPGDVRHSLADIS